MTTVLVVDDSAVDRKLAAACIEKAGCEVICAEDGREAIEQLKNGAPDIVLTDLQMPRVDGLDLVRRIKQDYPEIPAILMTAHGSEEIAAQALQQGASSYVPKHRLQHGLKDALPVVMVAVNVAKRRDSVRAILEESCSRFSLGYGSEEQQALIGHLQDLLSSLNFCDKSTLIRITTALTEAIRNAIDHGNLELDSKLREEEDDAYRKLGEERSQQPPYCKRRVRVTARVTASIVEIAVKDEGSGFDPSQLPDPTDPDNLLKLSGRGILLMRTFMDDVRFNDQGNEVFMQKRRADG